MDEKTNHLTGLPLFGPTQSGHLVGGQTPTGHPVVIKLGGALLGGDLSAFWHQIASIRTSAPVILVHGGGPQATILAEQLGHTPRIVEGRRVTEGIDLEILLMTMAGQLNTRLVAGATAAGLSAVGLTGADGQLIRVTKRLPWTINHEEVDFGHVGDIAAVTPRVLHTMLDGGFLPIVSPPGIDADGNLYNVNADTIALEIAVAVGAQELILVTGSSGIKHPTTGEVLPQVTDVDARTAVIDGWIHSGMQVKAHVGMQALERGIGSVWIAGLNDLEAKIKATKLRLEAVGV